MPYHSQCQSCRERFAAPATQPGRWLFDDFTYERQSCLVCGGQLRIIDGEYEVDNDLNVTMIAGPPESFSLFSQLENPPVETQAGQILVYCEDHGVREADSESFHAAPTSGTIITFAPGLGFAAGCPVCKGPVTVLPGRYEQGHAGWNAAVIATPDQSNQIRALLAAIDEVAGAPTISDEAARAKVWTLLAEIRETNPVVADEFTRLTTVESGGGQPRRSIWRKAANAIWIGFAVLGGINSATEFWERVQHIFTSISGLTPPGPPSAPPQQPPGFDVPTGQQRS